MKRLIGLCILAAAAGLCGCTDHPQPAASHSTMTASPEAVFSIGLKPLLISQEPQDTPRQPRARVLIFLATECPISNYYAPEIDRLCERFRSDSIAFYAVYEDIDLPPAQVRDHARAFGLRCPVLLDRQHELAKKVGAVSTPEAALIGPGDTLLYRGRIDDLYVALGQQRQVAQHHDLELALEDFVAGHPIKTPRTRAVGCAIEQ